MGTQTTFGRESGLGYEGQIHDNGLFEALSNRASEPVRFGAKLSYEDASLAPQGAISMIGIKGIVYVLDGDVSGDIEVDLSSIKTDDDTETINAIVEAFDTDHDTTVANFAATVQALASVSTAVVSDPNNRTITITAEDGYILKGSTEVFNGTTFTKTNSDTRTLGGHALRHGYKEYTGTPPDLKVRWETDEILSNVIKGNMVVQSPSGFDGEDTLYYVAYGKYDSDRGRISNAEADDTIAVPNNQAKQRVQASGSNSKGAISIEI